MKIDWEIAPEWANYTAQDGDGLWYWYQYEPTLDTDYDEWSEDGGLTEDADVIVDWQNTLQKRPK